MYVCVCMYIYIYIYIYICIVIIVGSGSRKMHIVGWHGYELLLNFVPRCLLAR